MKEEPEPLRECDDCVTSISYTAETVSLAGLGDLYRPAPIERAGNGLYHVQNVIEQHGGRLWRSVLLFTGDREIASDAVAEAFASGLEHGLTRVEGRRPNQKHTLADTRLGFSPW